MAARSSKILNVSPIQPPCRKRIYNSLEEAEEMIRHIKETRRTGELHAYKCQICGGWHLTSKALKY